MNLVRLQLGVVSSLSAQGITEWSQLSTVKLKASQLSLDLNPAKMPKSLEFVKNRLIHQLSALESEVLLLSGSSSSS